MKRTPINSPEGAVQAAIAAAKGPPKAPAHVLIRPGDEPFWLGIVRTRPLDEWTDLDLALAGQLARCQHDIEREQKALDAEGSTLVSARGTARTNPRVFMLEQLARREMAPMRTLRLGGRISGDARDDASRNVVHRRAARLHDELRDDDLLA